MDNFTTHLGRDSRRDAASAGGEMTDDAMNSRPFAPRGMPWLRYGPDAKRRGGGRMKVTRVSVEVRETVSLPGYANVSRGVTITAKIAGFGFEEAHGRIQKQAEKLVHRQIDDVLEEAGEPPKYFDGQRYSPVSCWRTGDSAVVPSGYVALPEGWSTVRTRTGFRSATAERLAMGEVRGNGRYLGVLQDGDCLPRNPIDSKPVDESESDRCDGCGDALTAVLGLRDELAESAIANIHGKAQSQFAKLASLREKVKALLSEIVESQDRLLIEHRLSESLPALREEVAR